MRFGDSRERWMFNHKGEIKSLKDTNKCLAVDGGEI